MSAYEHARTAVLLFQEVEIQQSGLNLDARLDTEIWKFGDGFLE
jgi:hypothetical protein